MEEEMKEDPLEELKPVEEAPKPEQPRITPPLESPKPKEPEPKPNPDKFWKITTAVLIILLAVFMWRNGDLTWGDNEVTGAVVVDDQPTPRPTPAPTPTVDMAQLIETDFVRGNENAPVTIVEFSDYECPFCGRFYTQSYLQIKTKYIDTGKVKYVFRDFPLSFHVQAEPAAIAANCAGEQGKYYEFHDELFANQGSLGTAYYRQVAQKLGLDITAWEACLVNPEQKQEVLKDFRDGQAAGVKGTPAFFVNGQLISGAQPYQVFEQLIEAALAG